ncbi:hypothetical protein KNP414_06023 [Paenibacillus mucilaginosus KNP414]|uniref:Uncharacterized protein n=1 Tax=Paenibacillus mucilaginosus (strain KNP414) TaxID=1036673 RepID=F8FEE8_PAEMK|nr:hypothetical protein KNP414_06023 [Paenibacillus mucilaginosus KNP414]
MGSNLPQTSESPKACVDWKREGLRGRTRASLNITILSR